MKTHRHPAYTENSMYTVSNNYVEIIGRWSVAKRNTNLN